MTDHPPISTCRFCGQPIRPFPGDGKPVWVHTGPRGAFPCRDEVTGMCLPTMAAPVTPPADESRAVGRYRLPPPPATPTSAHPAAPTSPPWHQNPPGRADDAHRYPPPTVGRDPRSTPDPPVPSTPRRWTLRPLFRLLRRRRPSRAHSLRRLRSALELPPTPRAAPGRG